MDFNCRGNRKSGEEQEILTLRVINRKSGRWTGHFNSQGNRKSDGKQKTLIVKLQETVIVRLIERVLKNGGLYLSG